MRRLTKFIFIFFGLALAMSQVFFLQATELCERLTTEVGELAFEPLTRELKAEYRKLTPLRSVYNIDIELGRMVKFLKEHRFSQADATWIITRFHERASKISKGLWNARPLPLRAEGQFFIGDSGRSMAVDANGDLFVGFIQLLYPGCNPKTLVDVPSDVILDLSKWRNIREEKKAKQYENYNKDQIAFRTAQGEIPPTHSVSLPVKTFDNVSSEQEAEFNQIMKPFSNRPLEKQLGDLVQFLKENSFSQADASKMIAIFDEHASAVSLEEWRARPLPPRPEGHFFIGGKGRSMAVDADGIIYIGFIDALFPPPAGPLPKDYYYKLAIPSDVTLDLSKWRRVQGVRKPHYPHEYFAKDLRALDAKSRH